MILSSAPLFLFGLRRSAYGEDRVLRKAGYPPLRHPLKSFLFLATKAMAAYRSPSHREWVNAQPLELNLQQKECASLYNLKEGAFVFLYVHPPIKHQTQGGYDGFLINLTDHFLLWEEYSQAKKTLFHAHWVR